MAPGGVVRRVVPWFVMMGCALPPVPAASPGAPARSVVSPLVVGDLEDAMLDGVLVDGDHVALEEGELSGVFRSRAFDTEGTATTTWISWEPDAPYGQPLPVNGVVEDYDAGGLDMSEAVLHLPFDGWPLLLPDGLSYVGASVHGHTVTAVGPMGTEPGVFGEALLDPLGSYLSIEVVPGHPLQLGTSDTTWAAWVKMTQDCPDEDFPLGNRVLMGIEEASGDETHLWMGCKPSSASDCAIDDGTARFGGTFRAARETDGAFSSESFCSASALNDGLWHHVAVVKEGHEDASLSVYFDGELEVTGPAAFAHPFTFETDSVEFTVGGFRANTFPAESTLDEVLVLTAAWTAEEVHDAYRRGRTDVQVRVRACSMVDCEDEPRWTDVVPEIDAGSPWVAEVSVSGRYLQYELSLTREDPDVEVRVGEVLFEGEVEFDPLDTAPTGHTGMAADTDADTDTDTDEPDETATDSGSPTSHEADDDDQEATQLSGRCGCAQEMAPTAGRWAWRRRDP